MEPLAEYVMDQEFVYARYGKPSCILLRKSGRYIDTDDLRLVFYKDIQAVNLYKTSSNQNWCIVIEGKDVYEFLIKIVFSVFNDAFSVLGNMKGVMTGLLY